METHEIDVREVFQALRRRFWILLLMPITAALTAGYISFNYLTPIYETSATVWVKGEPGDLSYTRVLTSEGITQTYSEVAMSRSVAAGAAQYLTHLGITSDDLSVVAQPVRATELIRLTVSDTDPRVAAEKANAYVKAFIDHIEASEMVQNIRVVDYARVPETPVKPRPVTNIAIAFALGLMVATGMTFLLEFFDTSIRTPEDLRRHVGGVVLATIPHVDLPKDVVGRVRTSDGLTPSVVVHKEPSSAAAEAFRVLRANLQFLGLDRPLKSILVTSAVPSEGKSFTSANLAVALAQSGARVCLVDADLRLPTQARLFGVRNQHGLTDVVIRSRRLEEVLEEPVPGVHLLTSGPIPPNPSELLGSERMEELLRDLEAGFDYVVIDSTPTLELADALSVAPRVTGVLLVARAGGVGHPQVARARQALMGVKANVLGLILEGARVRAAGYYYRYYHKTNGDDRAEARSN